MGIIKTLAIIIIPGAIPVWIGYKLYEKLKSTQATNDVITTVSESDVDNDGA